MPSIKVGTSFVKYPFFVVICLFLVAFAPAPMQMGHKDPEKAITQFEREAANTTTTQQSLVEHKKTLLEQLKKSQGNLLARGKHEAAQRVADYIALLSSVDSNRPLSKISCKEAIEKAASTGKYRKLLRVLYVPNDQASLGRFNDFGMWTGTAYAGETDLPTGYWVYAEMRWFIWAELTGK
jgi:hypothetical protein